MDSKVDKVINKGKKTRMLINYKRYDSKLDDWNSLENLFKSQDFVDLLFLKLVGKKPARKDRELLLKTLVLTSMGTGHDPPSVFVPKTISSITKDKRFALINGLIGGLTTFGTHHLGAVYDVMNTYMELKQQNIKDYVTRKIENKEVIFGFGHPVYSNDPRPTLLLKKIRDYSSKNVHLKNYESLSKILFQEKRLRPNIDAIVALSYTTLGFEPEHGVYLSFLARSLNMVCHISEEQVEKPFSFFVNNSRCTN